MRLAVVAHPPRRTHRRVLGVAPGAPHAPPLVERRLVRILPDRVHGSQERAREPPQACRGGREKVRATREKRPDGEHDENHQVLDVFREATRRSARSVKRRRGGYDISPPRANDKDSLACPSCDHHLFLRCERSSARDQFQARSGNVKETRARLRRRVPRGVWNGDDPFLPPTLQAPRAVPGDRGVRRELAQRSGARRARDLLGVACVSGDGRVNDPPHAMEDRVGRSSGNSAGVVSPKRRRVRGNVPRPFASRNAARCTGHGTDEHNTPPRSPSPSGRRCAARTPHTTLHPRPSRAPESLVVS